MNALTSAGKVIVTLLILVPVFATGVWSGRAEAAQPAASVVWPGSWSIEFEELCYEYDVDGSIYERRIKPTYHTGEPDLPTALIFAFQTFQLEFDQNGPFGQSGKIKLCTTPPPVAIPIRIEKDDEPWVEGHHLMPKVR